MSWNTFFWLDMVILVHPIIIFCGILFLPELWYQYAHHTIIKKLKYYIEEEILEEITYQTRIFAEKKRMINRLLDPIGIPSDLIKLIFSYENIPEDRNKINDHYKK